MSLKPATSYAASRASHNVAAFAVALGVFRENKGRSWRRAAHITAVRYSVGKAKNVSDMKFGFGVTTAEMYARWARKTGADVLTDGLSEGATLHWIGPRRQDRVLLFLHGEPFSPLGLVRLIEENRLGGGFVIPARLDYFYMLESLHKEYKGAVGIAMLNYCTCCNVRKLTIIVDRPTSPRTRTPLPEAAAPDNCRPPAPAGLRRVPV